MFYELAELSLLATRLPRFSLLTGQQYVEGRFIPSKMNYCLTAISSLVFGVSDVNAWSQSFHFSQEKFKVVWIFTKEKRLIKIGFYRSVNLEISFLARFEHDI